ncbi:MAG: zinc-ribbon domain-containing protein [Pyrinomonadaceae bacterium MAG19_C2-C3]|nr:zinc-ribbon domain-containing protein [Pyrinomonadaceae bacterium MAG19_C2-C3]
MIIFCQSCQTNFSLDDRRVPAQAFTVRCAKCNRVMTVEPPKDMAAAVMNSDVKTNNGAAVDPVASLEKAVVSPEKPDVSPEKFSTGAKPEGDVDSPALKHAMNVRRFALSDRAQRCETPEATSGAGENSKTDVLQLLAKLLQGETKNHVASIETPPEDEMRAALVCASATRANTIAELLARRGYEAFIAEDAASAVAMMREGRVGTVILDDEFDRAQDGTTHVRRMINRMQLAERRRLFLVGLAADVRTMDAHAAFVQSFNLIVNTSELDSLPDAMHRTQNAFRELYKEFNKATMNARI